MAPKVVVVGQSETPDLVVHVGFREPVLECGVVAVRNVCSRDVMPALRFLPMAMLMMTMMTMMMGVPTLAEVGVRGGG